MAATLVEHDLATQESEGYIQAIINHKKSKKTPIKNEKEAFGELLWNWTQVAWEALEKRVPEELNLLSKEAKQSLQFALQKRLEYLCAYSLVLELNIARIMGQLEGNTPKERYKHYLKEFLNGSGKLKAFFDEYHVLAGSVDRLISLWVNQAGEFLIRTHQDINQISRVFFSGKELGRIKKLKTGLSDPHNGGKGVYLLEFSAGLKIIYKPKQVGIEATFNEMLGMLNSMGLTPAMKTFTVLAKEDYGWVEYIQNKPCKSRQEVKKFFERAGINLCLFYLLEGTDGHYENLIASGEYPVIIDLETIFHARLRNPDEKSKELREEQTFDYFSVLTTGLLPWVVFSDSGKKGIDVSGLMGEEGQELPKVLPFWENINTDEMHLTYISWKTMEAGHRVKFKGKAISAKDHVEDIVNGFACAFDLIKEHRDALLASNGIVDKLGLQLVRYVARATRIYGQVVNRLGDAQFQRDAEAYEKELNLISVYIEKDNKHLLPMIEEEKRAIRLRDIPFFNSRPNSKDLFIQDQMVVPEAFAECALDAVKHRISSMNEIIKNQQIAYIRQSFYSMMTVAHEAHAVPFSKKEAVPALNDHELLDQATKIGDEILSHAIVFPDNSLNWIAMELLPNIEQFCFQPISDNLYNGKSGIALFFSALYKLTGDQKWSKPALEMMENLRKNIKKERADLWVASVGIGAMSGASSIAYVLFQMGELLNNASLKEDALHVLSLITSEKIKDDKAYDIISGSAGLILVLLSIYEKTKNSDLLEKAIIAGEHLLSSATKEGDEILKWPMEKDFLTGFSHGVAGVGYALMKLGSISGKKEFKQAAEKAMGYERKTFCPEEGNWPDFREGKKQDFMTSWCHGAPGIAMGRLCTLHYENKPEIYQEVEAAIKTTQNKLEGPVDHLCCGNFGRLELLRMAGEELNRPELLEDARLLASHLIHEKEMANTYRFFAHLPHKLFNPGFMTGAAGIGYSLIRFLDKEKVLPKVWVFE